MLGSAVISTVFTPQGLVVHLLWHTQVGSVAAYGPAADHHDCCHKSSSNMNKLQLMADVVKMLTLYVEWHGTDRSGELGSSLHILKKRTCQSCGTTCVADPGVALSAGHMSGQARGPAAHAILTLRMLHVTLQPTPDAQCPRPRIAAPALRASALRHCRPQPMPLRRSLAACSEQRTAAATSSPDPAALRTEAAGPR
eukprot:362854-Chlamydomonas_euryale.AAC.2